MGLIKGNTEYKKFKKGGPLTRKQAIAVYCYECNGFEAIDCLGLGCPLYQWFPYKKVSLFVPEKPQKAHAQGKNKGIVRRGK